MDLDLIVSSGEVVALLGPNGAGKTTTLLGLAGALKPMAGEVYWRGKVERGPLHTRCRNGRLAFVTDEKSLTFSLTALENLRLGRSDVERALALFPELGPHLHRRAGLLSGGQQQILAVACALSRSPQVLLVDELSLGLAPVVVERLMDAVRNAGDSGVAVILVEQHLQAALSVADRAYILRRGVVELAGPAPDLVDRIDEITQAYFT